MAKYFLPKELTSEEQFDLWNKLINSSKIYFQIGSKSEKYLTWNEANLARGDDFQLPICIETTCPLVDNAYIYLYQIHSSSTINDNDLYNTLEDAISVAIPQHDLRLIDKFSIFRVRYNHVLRKFTVGSYVYHSPKTLMMTCIHIIRRHKISWECENIPHELKIKIII